MSTVRVLHVVLGMNKGGVETWLMHVLRNTDRARFHHDFLVHTDQPAAYDAEIAGKGSRILPCPHSKPWSHAKQFFEVVRKYGPFDVIHSHVHHFSGWVLTLAKIAGIPIRIAHSHLDSAAADAQAGLVRRTYLAAMKRLIRSSSTHGCAASEPAAEALFGPGWRWDSRFRVLYCGVDLNPFHAPCNPDAARAEFGFSKDDLIFGHVGRFYAAKNHLFLMEVAARIADLEPRAKFLLVGDGPLRANVETRAAQLGLRTRIHFAGLRADIARVMQGAMDLFLLPSLLEGLPLVLMEAQAAGLASLVSECITPEAVVIPGLFRTLPLSAGPDEWARAALESASQPRFQSQRALKLLEGSRFDIRRGVRQLCDIYGSAV